MKEVQRVNIEIDTKVEIISINKLQNLINMENTYLNEGVLLS